MAVQITVSWRKAISRAWKLALSAAIVTYLLAGMSAEAIQILRQPKDWPCLTVGFLLCGSAICVTFVRWALLVRALGLDFPTSQALRIGMLGYLCNLLAPLGVAGGDGLKAAMLTWRSPGELGKSVASVLVDRVIGLYALLVLASIAILAAGMPGTQQPALRTLGHATLLATATGGGLALVLLIVPIPLAAMQRFLDRVPLLGRPMGQVLHAVLCYRDRPAVLGAAGLMSVGVHLLFATGVYFIARALPGPTHTYVQHLVIAPLSATAGVLPLPLGPFEWVFETLYTILPLANGTSVPAGRGLCIALAYRLATLLTAGLGTAISVWTPSRVLARRATSPTSATSPTLS